MQKYPNLPRAPIVEALGQINYQATDGTSLELEKIAETFEASHSDDIFEIRVLPTGNPTKNLVGKRIKISENIILQITNSFFSVSQTGGYEDWSKFSALLKTHFGKFLQVVKVQNISRLALRYINQFQLAWPKNHKISTHVGPFSLAT